MAARLLILGICLGFPLIAALAPAGYLAGLGPEWMLAIFAGLVGVIACVATGGRITSAILGGLMLAVATHQAPMTTSLMEAPGDVATWPQHDLTKAPLPDDAKGYVRLEGFLRPTMQLREFQVPQGDRPNQNEVAHAVLMPLVGTSAGVIKIEGRTVIARVPEKLRRGPERVQLAGALVAPPLGVTEVLIKLGHEGEEQKQVRAIMLDTTRTGYDEQPWVTAIIVGLTLLFATGQLWPRKRDED